MSITAEQIQNLTGTAGKVYTDNADKIGAIGQVYVDDTTGEPSWVTVKTGLFGTSESFVPLDGARVDGDDIVVAFDKDTVKDAPRVDPDGELSPEEESRLYSHYGMSQNSDTSVGQERDADVTSANDSTPVDGAPMTSGYGTTAEERAEQREGHPNAEGRDTSGPTTDDAMTRSEEQLNVGVQTRESGRARLRKYVVTENVTQTVPVRHEEVTLEREPITADNYDASQAGPAISEEEHEVILHEERPVVEKEAVAVERVRLGTETVTEEATISEDVRKEQIEMSTDTDGDSGTPQDSNRNR